MNTQQNQINDIRSYPHNNRYTGHRFFNGTGFDITLFIDDALQGERVIVIPAEHENKITITPHGREYQVGACMGIPFIGKSEGNYVSTINGSIGQNDMIIVPLEIAEAVKRVYPNNHVLSPNYTDSKEYGAVYDDEGRIIGTRSLIEESPRTVR
jgi:hypothetical protein